MNARRTLSSALPLFVLACSSTPPAERPAPTSAPVAPVTAVPVETAAPAPTAQPTAAPDSPFRQVAVVPEEIRLFAVGKTAYAIGQNTVAEVTGEGLRTIGNGRKELPEWGDPGFVGGAAGTDFLAFMTSNGTEGYSILLRRQGTTWKEEKTLALGNVYSGFGPWKDGSVLAATLGVGFKLPSQKPSFVVISGRKGGEPKIPASKVKGCVASMFPMAMLSFPTGEVLALGPACKRAEAPDDATPGDRALLLHWAAGKQDPTVFNVLDLPEDLVADDGVGVLAGISPADVWLASGESQVKPYLAHFDGKAVTPVQGVPEGPPTSLALAGDGTLYTIIGKLVYKHAPGGAWEKIALPPKHDARTLAVSGADVWVGARPVSDNGKPKNETVLLRLAAPSAAAPK